MVPTTASLPPMLQLPVHISKKKPVVQRVVHLFYQSWFWRDVAFTDACRYIPCRQVAKGIEVRCSRDFSMYRGKLPSVTGGGHWYRFCHCAALASNGARGSCPAGQGSERPLRWAVDALADLGGGGRGNSEKSMVPQPPRRHDRSIHLIVPKRCSGQ